VAATFVCPVVSLAGLVAARPLNPDFNGDVSLTSARDHDRDSDDQTISLH
jgi:hypothetical protein